MPGRRPARVSRVAVSPFTAEGAEHWVRRVRVEVSATYPFTGFEDVGTFDVPPEPADREFRFPRPRRARAS